MSDSGGHEAAGMMRWLLTYADVITLLLIVFTLMYAFSQVNQEKFETANESFQGVFSSKGGGIFDKNGQGVVRDITLKRLSAKYGVPSNEVAKMMKTREELKNEYEKGATGAAENENINLAVTERGLVISFAGQVLFESGKAEINKGMAGVLGKTAGILAKTTNSIRIEGFTDNRPINNSKFGSNWELSAARATTVLRYFIEKYKMDPKRFAAAGYGEYKPVVSNNSEKNKATNRRVDIVLLYPSLDSKEPK